MSFFNLLPTRVLLSSANIASYTAGEWKRDVPLDSLAPVDSDATFAIFECITSGTSTTLGIQNSDAETDTLLPNIARKTLCQFIKINDAKTIDTYCANFTYGKTYLLGYTSHLKPIAEYSSPALTAGVTTVIDLSVGDVVPAEAANGWVLIRINSGIKFSMTTPTSEILYSCDANTYVVFQLTAARTIKAWSGAPLAAGAFKIIAWCDEKCFIASTNTVSPLKITASTPAWETLNQFYTTVFNQFHLQNSATVSSAGGSSTLIGIRPKGDDSYSAQVQNTWQQVVWTKVSEDGGVDAYTNAPATAEFRYFGGFVADTSAANIESVTSLVDGANVSGLVDGATSTITLDKFVSSFPTLFIKGSDGHVISINGLTYTGSDNKWIFDLPQRQNGVEGIRLGAVTLTPVTNAGTGADFIDTYTAKNRSLVEIENIVIPNVGTKSGLVPAISAGDQVSFDSTKGQVDKHAAYSNTAAWYGVQQMENYSNADKKWYFFEWETIAIAADTAPRTDDFGSVTGVALNEFAYAQKSIIILDVDADIDVPVVAGADVEYRVNNGFGFGDWTAANSPVRLNYRVEIRLKAANTYSTQKQGKLTIGGVDFIFNATTRAINTIPSPVMVTWPIAGVYISNGFIIAGVDAGADVSIAVGAQVNCTAQYSINDAAFTDDIGVTHLGESIKIKLTVTDPDAQTPSATLMLGGSPVVFYPPINDSVAAKKQNNFVASFM